MFEEEEEGVDFNTLVEPTAQPLPPVEEAPIEQPAPIVSEEPVDFNTLVAPEDEEGVDFSALTGEEPKEEGGLTKDQLIANPEKLDAVRAYMVDRKGHQWLDRPAEELMDAYVTHMRWVGTNEVNTIGEYIYITGGEDESRKEIAGKAYQAYNELGSFLTNDGISGALGGALDYAGSVILSPSTWIGGLAGRGVAAATTSVAKKAIMDAAVKSAFKTGGKEAAETVLKSSARTQAFKTVGAATAVDATLSTGQDAVYQMTMMESGIQDDYSLFQGGIAAVGGLVGGGVALGLELKKGSSGLSLAGESMKAAKSKRKAQAAAVAAPKVGQAVKQLARNMKEWRKMVEDGAGHEATRDDMLNYTSWFFDVENPKSPINIIVSSGAEFDKETPFTHQAIEFVRGLPAKDLKAYNKELAPLGVKFGDLLDIVADTERVGGTALQLAQRASLVAQKAADLMVANKRADGNILRGEKALLDAAEDAPAADPKHVRYMQSLWRRMLVSHPSTTAVNVMGWSQAYGARTMAEMIHGGVLGTAGLVGKMVGLKFGDKAWAQSQNLLKNQIFKTKMLLDPFASKEAFEELMVQTAPKKLQKAALKDYFGGVDQNPAEFYGMNPKGPFVRRAEQVADFAAKATFVKVQDGWTKTFSGLSELDLLSRMEYGKGIAELIDAGEANLITPEMWDRVTKVMLKDTFSMDYTKGTGALNMLARVPETLSNTPGVGFLFPFGRFMNNSLAFTMEYSPIGLLPLASKIAQAPFSKGARTSLAKQNSYDIGESVTKAVAGTVALMTIMDYTQKTMDSGLQWNMTEDSKGTITNKQTLAPASVFLLTGRMLKLWENDEVIPEELWTELGMQLGFGTYAREMGESNPLADVIRAVSRSSPEEQADYGRLIMEGLASMSGQVVAGYTRPLDVPNRIVGMATENNMAIDKRQSSGMEAITVELTRYTSNLFAPFLGEPAEEGGPNVIGTPLRTSVQPGDVRDPNPVSSAMGVKELGARTPIQLLLGQVNFPEWKADVRTKIPEFDHFVNERVEPLLNRRAAKMMVDPRFVRASRGEKLSQVKKLMQDTRDEIRDWIENGQIGDTTVRLNNVRRAWTALPQIERDEARKAFDIDTPDKDLSEFQIDMMKRYMEDRATYFDYMRE